MPSKKELAARIEALEIEVAILRASMPPNRWAIPPVSPLNPYPGTWPTITCDSTNVTDLRVPSFARVSHIDFEEEDVA